MATTPDRHLDGTRQDALRVKKTLPGPMLRGGLKSDLLPCLRVTTGLPMAHPAV